MSWRSAPTSPVTLYAEFTAVPGHETPVSNLVTDYATLVRAEPGNRVFDVYQVRAHPDRFFVIEVYSGQDAFEAHLTSPAAAEFNAALLPHIVEDASQLTFLHPTAVRTGHTSAV